MVGWRPTARARGQVPSRSALPRGLRCANIPETRDLHDSAFELEQAELALG